MSLQLPEQSSAYPIEMVADFAHDVCGSVHTILGYASLLGDRIDDEELRGMLESLTIAARRLTTVAEAVGATTGRPADPIPVDEVHLDRTLTEARERWEMSLAARRIEVDLVVGHVPVILAAASGFADLLDLLISTAIRHSARGSSLTVSVEVEPTEVQVHFDTPGHSPLDRFECHLIAHLSHQGGLGVAFEEIPGGHRVVLRATIASRSVDFVSNQVVVLHVDDDGAARDLVSAVLAAEGMEIISVGSLDEARDALRSRTPDALIIDQRLGEDRGMEFIRTIRPSESSLPVVMLSADHGSDLENDAAELGVMLVRKPVANDVLVASVHAVLGVYL